MYAGVRADQVFIPLTILDFKELWRTHFRVEILAENLRQKLSENPVFKLKNAFEVMDFGGKGSVSFADIKMLCEGRGFFISDKEAHFILNKFDQGMNRGAFG